MNSSFLCRLSVLVLATLGASQVVGCAAESETGSCVFTYSPDVYPALCKDDVDRGACEDSQGGEKDGVKIAKASFDSASCDSRNFTVDCPEGFKCEGEALGTGGTGTGGTSSSSGGGSSSGGTSSGGTSSGGTSSTGGTGGGSACTDDDASGDRDHGEGSDCDGSAVQFTGTLDEYDIDVHTFTMIDDGLCVHEPKLNVSVGDADFPVFNGAGAVCFSATCVNGGEDAITDCGPDASSTSDGCCATAGAFSYAFVPTISCASGDYSVNLSVKLGKVSAGCGAEYTVEASF